MITLPSASWLGNSSSSLGVSFLSRPLFIPAVVLPPRSAHERGPMCPWGGRTYIGEGRQGLVPGGRVILLLFLFFEIMTVIRPS